MPFPFPPAAARRLRLSVFQSFSLCALALVALAGCVTPGGSANGHNPVIPATSSTAVLRAGDSLVITLQGVPDPSSNAVQVDEQGFVTLPLIGAVSAAGGGTAELAQRVRDASLAKKIYRTVDVSVSVTERYVYVGGEVARPGRIIWTPDLTLAKAIQSAGGFTLYAKETAVSLVRDRVAYAVDAALAQRAPAEDPPLMPGDSLQVPRSAF